MSATEKEGTGVPLAQVLEAYDALAERLEALADELDASPESIGTFPILREAASALRGAADLIRDYAPPEARVPIDVPEGEGTMGVTLHDELRCYRCNGTDFDNEGVDGPSGVEVYRCKNCGQAVEVGG